MLREGSEMRSSCVMPLMAGGRQEVPDRFRTAACRFNVLNLSPKINCLAGKFGAAEWRIVIHSRGLRESLAGTRTGGVLLTTIQVAS